MFARVSRYEGDTDSATGRAVSITLWDTQEALNTSAERAHAMRTRASEPANATVVSVESYELLLTVEGRTRTR